MDTQSELKRKFRAVWPHLDERTRRIMAANEAVSLGYGGVSLVQRACGLSRKAIAKGIAEIQGGSRRLVGRVRRPGAGRKSITESDPCLVQTLEGLIDEQTRGDPESALRWICKSTRAIARELGQQKHPVSHMKVAQILHDLDYSLQSNRKTEEGADHPDRDAQFRHINAAVKKWPLLTFMWVGAGASWSWLINQSPVCAWDAASSVDEAAVHIVGGEVFRRHVCKPKSSLHREPRPHCGRLLPRA